MQPMSPVIEGHEEAVFAKEQSDVYNPLPAIRLESREGEVITRWKPDAGELAALNNGASIYLHNWTFNGPLQPILLHVATPEEIEDGIKAGTAIRYIEVTQEEVAFASAETQ